MPLPDGASWYGGPRLTLFRAMYDCSLCGEPDDSRDETLQSGRWDWPCGLFDHISTCHRLHPPAQTLRLLELQPLALFLLVPASLEELPDY